MQELVTKEISSTYLISSFYTLDPGIYIMMDKCDATDKTRTLLINSRISLIATFLGVFTLSTGFVLLSSTPLTAFGQPSPSLSEMPLNQGEDSGNQLGQLEAIRQEYLSVWNTTAFSSQFDVFVAEGTDGGYGVYREHVPANVFRPGETIVLYMEPVGFGHQPITATSTDDIGINNASVSMPQYLIEMTVDIIISDATGTQLQALEDLPGASFISHRQNTEFPLVVTLTQSEPFPVGDYILSYVIYDQVTGQSFQIDRQITIDDNAVTGAAPLPDIISNDTSPSAFRPQQQLDEGPPALEP
jgi:hypothetical protein